MAERLNEVVVTIRIDTTKLESETTLKLLADESIEEFRQRVAVHLDEALASYEAA
jgi:hypothetical protein